MQLPTSFSTATESFYLLCGIFIDENNRVCDPLISFNSVIALLTVYIVTKQQSTVM